MNIGKGSIPVLPAGPADPAAVAASASYARILKSSALIGGSTLVNVLVGIVRTKVFAMLLGPAGVGLMGAYMSVVDLMRTVAELGVSRSGVRQIAEAMGTGDATRVAVTVTVLRRVSLVLGVLGALLMLVLSAPLAQLTFGSTSGYQSGIAFLALAVLLGVVTGGQTALLQGARRIGELASMNVVGSVLGTLAAIAVVYVFGGDGVAAALVVLAALGAVISWWYARRVEVQTTRLAFVQVRAESVALLKLGLAFLISGLLMMGAAYVVRIIVVRLEGLSGAGLYHAAWTMGGLYVGFILQAMATDFYPRLVALIERPSECNQLVNEQAHVSLLLAGPGVVATIVLSEVALRLFYTPEFAAAADTLRWICFGMALRVITWPMGFIIVAKNNQRIFIAAELAWTVVNLGLSWLLVSAFGVLGAGFAFFASYVFHAALVYPIVRHMTGFAWTSTNLRGGAWLVGASAVLVAGFHLLSPVLAYGLGAVLLFIICLTSLRGLFAIIGTRRLPSSVEKLLAMLRSLAPVRRWF